MNLCKNTSFHILCFAGNFISIPLLLSLSKVKQRRVLRYNLQKAPGATDVAMQVRKNLPQDQKSSIIAIIDDFCNQYKTNSKM